MCSSKNKNDFTHFSFINYKSCHVQWILRKYLFETTNEVIRSTSFNGMNIEIFCKLVWSRFRFSSYFCSYIYLGQPYIIFSSSSSPSSTSLLTYCEISKRKKKKSKWFKSWLSKYSYCSFVINKYCVLNIFTYLSMMTKLYKRKVFWN